MSAAPRSEPLAAALEVDPFHGLAVHFGMLLGVSDFQVLAANPRGKLALHQAWQHGKGVVWGFPVRVAAGSIELNVGPGLAVDGLGREVASATEQCLDAGTWFDTHVAAGTLTPGADGRFDARLVARHEACLSRPVPTIASTCGDGTDSVGYSRVLELAHLELRPLPDPPPDDRDATFADLRALVRDGTLPDGVPRSGDRLADLRAVVAGVVAGLAPPGVAPPQAADSTRLFPQDEPGEIVLADLRGAAVVRTADGRRLLDAPVIDLSVRRSHVPVWVLSELFGELLRGSVGDVACPSDAGGPRVSGPVRCAGSTVTIDLAGPVVDATVAGALEVGTFDRAAGWVAPVVPEPTVEPVEDGARITFELPAPPTADRTYRVVLRGTGPTPLVGLVDGRPVPLAGRLGDPPGSRAQGRDVAARIPDRPDRPDRGARP